MAGMDLEAVVRAELGAVQLLHEDGVSQVFGTDSRAVKVCRWPTVGERDFARFADEVRRMTALSRAGLLVPLLGSGFLPGDLAYVVMRRCEGGSIERYLPLPVDVARDVVATVGRALTALHEAGVVHGVLTPRKILVSRDGTPRLGLFGVDAVARPSPYAVISGTLNLTYVAMERLRSLPGTPATDVFSLGAVLYGLLAGHPPHFPPDRELSMHEQFKLLGVPPPAHPAVPAGLLAVIRRAMRTEPAERQPDVASFLADVQATSDGIAEKTDDGS
jgi:serine/threonine protein kinase